MSDFELKTLQLARKCLFDQKEQDAFDYYMEVFKENSDNPEAAFFSYERAFTKSMSSPSDNQETRTLFFAVSDSITKAITYAAESSCTKEEKLFLTTILAYHYLPIANSVIKVPFTSPSERIQLAVTTLYAAGNAIEAAYAPDTESMKLAVRLWKDGVKLHQQFYSYTYSGNKAEDYVAKIQTVEPDYVMPKKAGCISFG